MVPSQAVILLNFKRPQNIGPIARTAREALPDAAILVLDQADDDSLRTRDDVDWSDIWLRRPGSNRGAGARVPLAAGLPFDHYLCIDDDTFLTPTQVAALMQRLATEPDRAHGIWGERLEVNDGLVSFRSGMCGLDAPLSNLNQVYAFHRRQAAAAIALSRRIGIADWGDVRWGNDILLSCAAPKPPLCHALGQIEMCPTANTPGIAVWKNEGFPEARADLARRLIQARAIAVYAPLTYSAA